MDILNSTLMELYEGTVITLSLLGWERVRKVSGLVSIGLCPETQFTSCSHHDLAAGANSQTSREWRPGCDGTTVVPYPRITSRPRQSDSKTVTTNRGHPKGVEELKPQLIGRLYTNWLVDEWLLGEIPEASPES